MFQFSLFPKTLYSEIPYLQKHKYNKSNGRKTFNVEAEPLHLLERLRLLAHQHLQRDHEGVQRGGAELVPGGRRVGGVLVLGWFLSSTRGCFSALLMGGVSSSAAPRLRLADKRLL